MNVRLVPALVMVFSLLTLSAPLANADTPKAIGLAAARGGTTILWNIYPSPTFIVQGSGMVRMEVQGTVEQGPGVYWFDTAQVSVIAQAIWTGSDGTTFKIFAKVTEPMAVASRGTVQGDAHPDVNAFIIFSTGFKGFLFAKGVKTLVEGTAKIWALTPETSFQRAEAKYLAVRLEIGPTPPTLGSMSFVLSWSETAQTVGGVPLLAADLYFQRVRLITSNAAN